MVVVADEPTSALDISARAQIVNLTVDLKCDLGVRFVFISHDPLTVSYISDRIKVMHPGEIVECGPADEILRARAHSYTQALIAAAPVPDPMIEDARVATPLQGELPSPLDLPAGCALSSRCLRATALCRERKPVLAAHSKTREADCRQVD